MVREEGASVETVCLRIDELNEVLLKKGMRASERASKWFYG